MRLMLFVVLFSPLKLLAQNLDISHGTSVFAAFTKDTIWISADTREAINYNTISGHVHKIQQRGNIFFGIVGIRSGGRNKKDTVFNFVKLIDSVVKAEKTALVSFNMFDSIIRKRLYYIYFNYQKKQIQSQPINTYNKIFGFFISEYHNGVPIFLTREYSLHRVDANNIEILIVPENKNYELNHFIGLGVYDNAIAYVTAHPQVFMNQKPEMLTCLTKLESEYDSINVGLPVDVIAIYNNGHKWYRDLNYCALLR